MNDDRVGADIFDARLEIATRGLLELSVGVLGEMEERVSPSHLRALQALGNLGGGKVTELGDALGVPPSTASRISDRLTAAGLITREVAPGNRRATWLALTHAGRAILDELTAARAQALSEVTARMPAASRDALLAGAEAFATAYHQVRERHDQAHEAHRGDPPDAGTGNRER